MTIPTPKTLKHPTNITIAIRAHGGGQDHATSTSSRRHLRTDAGRVSSGAGRMTGIAAARPLPPRHGPSPSSGRKHRSADHALVRETYQAAYVSTSRTRLEIFERVDASSGRGPSPCSPQWALDKAGGVEILLTRSGGGGAYLSRQTRSSSRLGIASPSSPRSYPRPRAHVRHVGPRRAGVDPAHRASRASADSPFSRSTGHRKVGLRNSRRITVLKNGKSNITLGAFFQNRRGGIDVRTTPHLTNPHPIREVRRGYLGERR